MLPVIVFFSCWYPVPSSFFSSFFLLFFPRRCSTFCVFHCSTPSQSNTHTHGRFVRSIRGVVGVGDGGGGGALERCRRVHTGTQHGGTLNDGCQGNVTKHKKAREEREKRVPPTHPPVSYLPGLLYTYTKC